MFTRLMEGDPWKRNTLFAVIVVLLLAGWFLLTRTGSTVVEGPAPKPTYPNIVTPTKSAQPTPEPTGTKDPTRPSIKFPLTQPDLDRAAETAVNWLKTVNTFTWETSKEDYTNALKRLAYKGNWAALLGDGTPGPLGLDASAANAQKLVVKGDAAVMSTTLVSKNSVTFLMAADASSTANGKTVQSPTLYSRLTVERDTGAWKVSSVSEAVSGSDLSEE